MRSSNKNPGDFLSFMVEAISKKTTPDSKKQVTAIVKKIPVGTTTSSPKGNVTFVRSMKWLWGKEINIQPSPYNPDHYFGYSKDMPSVWFAFHKDWLNFHEEGEQTELPLFESKDFSLDPQFGPELLVRVRPDLKGYEKAEYKWNRMDDTSGTIFVYETMKPYIGKIIRVHKFKPDGLYRQSDKPYWWHRDWLDFKVSEEGDQQELPLFESGR